MVAKRRNPPHMLAWVRVDAWEGGRWPEWRRRWLVLADGRVFVPVPHTPATSEGAAAVRDNAPRVLHAGHVLVEAGWLLERRTGEAAAMLRSVVERVGRRAA
jgi:hypothetical protein